MRDGAYLTAPWTLARWSQECSRGPFLGVDWGECWCGLAISDEEGRVAVPLQVVATGGPLRHALCQAWRDYGFRAVIMGMPYDENRACVETEGRHVQDGDFGLDAYAVQLGAEALAVGRKGQRRVQRQVAALAQRLLQQHAWPVVLWDEWGTTQEAKDLAPAQMKRKSKNSQRWDHCAASILLQEALRAWHRTRISMLCNTHDVRDASAENAF